MNKIVCIAGGPSLTKSDVELCEMSGVPLLGINNAYLITDKLKYHYACDTKWWEWAYSTGKGAPPYPPQEHTRKFSLNNSGRPKKRGPDHGWPGVTQMRMGERQGLSRKWPVLCWGGNSGYQAINLAYLLGYKQIILLGYDMQEINGKSHWHRDHRFYKATNPAGAVFKTWICDFKALAKALTGTGVTVINASRKTALDAFPLVRLEDALWQ